MRSLHRYASSAMALTVTVHLLRELWFRRYEGARWFSWISGVPLLWLLFASALGGYWLVWDERARYVAEITAALFDALPVVAEPMAFGMLSNSAVGDRLFTLLIFLHVGIPLALLLGMFIHIQRVARAKIYPGRFAAIVVIVGLVVVSFIKPAESVMRANFDVPLHDVRVDWLYMNVFPLVEAIGAAPVWALLTGLTGLLLALPLLPRFSAAKADIAVVDPEFCNGCGWCFIDCPFEAITMKVHDFKAGHNQAVVDADRCVGCGICAGACPTATPFKSVNAAYSGINLERESNASILEQIRNDVQGGGVAAKDKLLLLGCTHGADLKQFESETVATRTFECIGQLPPSYLDFLVRREGLRLILLTGCEPDACFHRHGIELTDGRLEGEREPHLRFRDVRTRVSTLWAGEHGGDLIREKIAQMQTDGTLDQPGERAG